MEHQDSVAHVTSNLQDNSAVIALAETVNSVILEPQSETIIPVKIPKFHMGSTVILEPCHKLQSRFSIAGGKTVCNIENNNMGIYRLLNPTNQTIYLDSKVQIAVVQLLNFRNIHAFKEQDEGFLCSVFGKTRKIASENIEVAQERNKRHYDKNTQELEFRLTQRVSGLYCTKVPVGKAPKLHRKMDLNRSIKITNLQTTTKSRQQMRDNTDNKLQNRDSKNDK
ncbi:unnamed protein product [Mytilus edulis]|uniref:Uncharacterized protein n=1 Tax=Mytilus edulis TaxID=6550 RepID=A0A8S3VLV7_MYTED|nr:unnamed protein product [Mytilus edulis]